MRPRRSPGGPLMRSGSSTNEVGMSTAAVATAPGEGEGLEGGMVAGSERGWRAEGMGRVEGREQRGGATPAAAPA